MYRLILLFTGVIFGFAASASDSIIVKKDPRLDVLTARQSAINKRTSIMTSNGQYKGFRVQVLSTRDRSRAFDVKAQLLSRFPEEKTYTLYQSPYFKVRIGNFLKKEDAEAFRKSLSRLFPDGAYVVPDVIEYTPTEEEELFLE
ncbi:MAG TPA: SPOR domain-containing protein [Chitinophagaceae bacterium]